MVVVAVMMTMKIAVMAVVAAVTAVAVTSLAVVAVATVAVKRAENHRVARSVADTKNVMGILKFSYNSTWLTEIPGSPYPYFSWQASFGEKNKNS